VKDADKTWRVSPHGVDTVSWTGSGWTEAQGLRLCSQRVRGYLFTREAKVMASALSALESVALGLNDGRSWAQIRL
jgi:hypothetical protein